MKKVNFKTMMSTAILGMFLVGCGSGTSKIDKSINTAEKNRSSTLQFINATNDMTNFYMRPRGISETIYTSEYQVASITERGVSEKVTYRWNELLNNTEFAVTDSVTLTQKNKVNITIENGDIYWGIAWLDNNDYTISIVNAVSNPSSDNYAIRFFSTTKQNIFVGDSDTSLTVTEKGEITASFAFDNCVELEVINDNLSNFCQIANAGESYIAVIGGNGEVIIAQE